MWLANTYFTKSMLLVAGGHNSSAKFTGHTQSLLNYGGSRRGMKKWLRTAKMQSNTHLEHTEIWKLIK